MRLTRTFRAFALIASLVLTGCVDKPQGPVAVADTAPEPAAANEPAIDADSGLLIDDHWQLVKAHCSVCHSPQLITQQRGSRQTWLSLIRWMQETQGLWVFDEATESGILDYLEKNYAPLAVSRRAPIPVDLMPENPYSPTEKQ
jgi:hypothetical protein